MTDRDPDKTPPQTPSAIFRSLTIPSEYTAAMLRLQDEAASIAKSLTDPRTNRVIALDDLRRRITKAFILGRESAGSK